MFLELLLFLFALKLKCHLHANFTLNELRVFGLFLDIDDKHPISLIVQCRSGDNELRARRAYRDSVRTRLSLRPISHFRGEFEQRILIERAACLLLSHADSTRISKRRENGKKNKIDEL